MINIGTTFVDGLPIVTLKLTAGDQALISSMTPIQAVLLGQDLMAEARRVERLRPAPESVPDDIQAEAKALTATSNGQRKGKGKERSNEGSDGR